MKSKTFFSLCFWLVCFFSCATAAQEKDLRQLHHQAESAMGKGDFIAAKEAYIKIVSKIAIPSSSFAGHRYRVEWSSYIDFVTRLAQVHLALKEYAEGEELLNQLLRSRPPKEYLPSIRLLMGKLCSQKQAPGEAYLWMKQATEELPEEFWKAEDRTYFHSLSLMLDSHYDQLIQKAKRFFVSAQYIQAKEMYEELLNAIERGYYPKISSTDSLLKKKVKCRLAETNYYLADYQKSLSYLNLNTPPEDKIDCHMLYLAAHAFKEQHDYEKALNYFSSYLSSADKGDLDHYDHALLEIGLGYYKIGQLTKAQSYFEALQAPFVKKEKPSQIALIYLARIALKENQPRQAEEKLAHLATELKAQDPLRYEAAYLRGLVASECKEYAQAVDFFEQAFPPPPLAGAWCHDALFQLGICYLKLGDDSLKSKTAQTNFFSKAEAAFQRILYTSQGEKAALAIAKLYLLRATHFDELFWKEKLELFLKQKQGDFSEDGKIQSLLLRAQAQENCVHKTNLFEEATSSRFENNSYYSDAWFFRGLHDFQRALKNPSDSTSLLHSAITNFEKAYLLTESSRKEKAVDALKWEAKANFCLSSPQETLLVFEKLLDRFPVCIQEKEEILYLKGLAAAQLPQEKFSKIAFDSLQNLIREFPNGHFIDRGLYLLGSLYYQIEDYKNAYFYFLQLGRKHPDSSLAGEGIFWAAEAAERDGLNSTELRKWMIRAYPHSPHTSEAYFRLFPIENYLEGSAEALSHLENFSALFPTSYLQIVSSYLLGMNAKNEQEAFKQWEAGLKAFKNIQLSHYPPALIYFYYRTQVDRAFLHLKNPTTVECAIQDLEEVQRQFLDTTHCFSSQLRNQDPYPSLLQECEYGIGCGYAKANKLSKAQDAFGKMIRRYTSLNIHKEYFLALGWQQLGKLALIDEDYQVALHCFDRGEETGDGFLSTDQKLEMWILKSTCYKGLKDWPQAMKMLSKAINEDVASSQRIQAMLLRAEIYEMQGRQELAIRQLEAVVKKGGEWGGIAREKLDLISRKELGKDL